MAKKKRTIKDCEAAVDDFMKGYPLAEAAKRNRFSPEEMEELVRMEITAGVPNYFAAHLDFMKTFLPEWAE